MKKVGSASQPRRQRWPTFLIRYGCISQFEPEMPDQVRNFLKDTYGAYEYGYNATLTDDIHVDKNRLPQAMRDMLEDFRQHPFIPHDARHDLQRAEPEQTNGEKFER